ncbi:MAG: hypothetical protein ACNS60_07175 [Candidatus Cyclobacteriaceae bacterium M2_1C_046]
MSSNIFSGRRFSLLIRQYFIHNTQLMLLSTVAYIGVIFIILSFIQMENQFIPNDHDVFLGSMIAFVAIFGILFIGHAFPAFRSKESTINYIMVPASVLEKFTFEFVIRMGVIIIALPLLYWLTFHLQGYFFTIFTDDTFEPIGLMEIAPVEISEVDHIFWLSTLIISAVLLAFVFVFTGAATFVKQPLVKSLFAVALILAFYMGYSFIVLEVFGLGSYDPPKTMWLLPNNESVGFGLITILLVLSNLIMLYVAYRKLKEKEV